ncbi:RagB/SusD family nutrient uptake outer membrane protein [Leeuwenhoekiella sp. NPDC079379]|uniref:RagB/SusD family nutrient uptake outer membrane protein n=1 Tax=Leeuwenhoekiella sp. NPDC079379 TaxID=3364122 RepID=UPI0037CCBACB
MKNIKTIVTLCVGFWAVTACDSEDLNLKNPNDYSVPTYYQNTAELLAGTNAIYATIQSNQMYAREFWFLHDLRGDDNKSGGGQLELPRAALLTGTNNADNAVATAVWKGSYTAILRANTVIERGAETPDISDADRKTLIGEAKFARGWMFFELGSLWGGVPLATKVATDFNEGFPKATQEAVLNQAITDLSEAAEALPVASNTTIKGRFSKGAALAMLGRVYMYTGQYGLAKDAFDAIVDSQEYKLIDQYDENFQEENEFNDESILEIGYANVGGFDWGGTGNGTNEQAVRTQEYSHIGWRNLIPSNALLNDFERVSKGDAKNDPRFAMSFYKTGDMFNNGTEVVPAAQGETTTFEGETTEISWRKYSLMYKENPGGFKTGGINMRVIRYAEVLLNLAECELEAGDPARAITLMNQVRSRASVNMPGYPTTAYPVGSEQQIMNAIMHEKRVELSSEQIRNRDILRWRKEGKFTAEPLANFEQKLLVLPIPQSEIDNNPALTQADQNPGY